MGSVAWRRDGGLVLGLGAGFGLLGPDDRSPTSVPVDTGGHELWMNDGACDRAGRFWAGTASHVRGAEVATLYRLDPDHSVHPVIHGVQLSNGIGWSPDDRLMYYVDSPTQGLDVFDFDLDAGAVRNRRRLVDIEPAMGIPDGLAVDVDGCLWLAIWGSGRVRRYTPTGHLDRVIEVPASQVTSCAFGGPRLDQLYISSAAEGLGPEARRAEPHAGSLFCLDPGIEGLPPQGYAG